MGVVVWWKLKINTDVASDSNDGEIYLMYKYVKDTKGIWRYMEDLEIQTVEPTVHW